MHHVERDREPGHAVGREPLLRQPDVRLEAEAALLEVALDLLHGPLDDGAAQREAEVAEAQAEQLLVREMHPGGLGDRSLRSRRAFGPAGGAVLLPGPGGHRAGSYSI